MIATAITRAFQLLFGIVALALSVTAFKWQFFGTVPATTSYSIFASAFCMLAAFIGCIALFLDAFPGIIMAGIDGLCAICLLAGGIAFAVQLRGVHCGSSDEDILSQLLNFLLNGGTQKSKSGPNYGVGSTDDVENALQSRCRIAEADTAFLFLGFVACTAAAVFAMIGSGRQRGGLRHSAV